jgi:hypothetical protein
MAHVIVRVEQPYEDNKDNLNFICECGWTSTSTDMHRDHNRMMNGHPSTSDMEQRQVRHVAREVEYRMRGPRLTHGHNYRSTGMIPVLYRRPLVPISPFSLPPVDLNITPTPYSNEPNTQSDT